MDDIKIQSDNEAIKRLITSFGGQGITYETDTLCRIPTERVDWGSFVKCCPDTWNKRLNERKK